MAPISGLRGHPPIKGRALWYDEAQETHVLRQRLEHVRKKLSHILHSVWVQLIVSCVILFDLGLTIAGWIGMTEVRGMTLAILSILSLEVMVRIWVHEDKFQRREICMLSLEIWILIFGLVSYFVEGFFPVAAARAARLLSRNLRAARVLVQCYGRKRKLAQAMNAQLRHMIRAAVVKAFGKFLRVRPENLKVDIGGCFEITKANLVSGAFLEWHLPLVLLGGFVGHCRASFEADEGHDTPSHLMVHLQNLLLVLGPGPQANWKDETMIEGRKAQLLDAIAELFIVGAHKTHRAISDVKSSATGAAYAHEKVLSVSQRMMRSLEAMIHRRLLEGLQIKIENVSLAYEDEKGALFSAPNSGGVNLGGVRLQLKAEMQDATSNHTRLTYFIISEVSRLSAFWELGVAPYAPLLRHRLHEQALQRLISSNRMEVLRLGVASQLQPRLAREVMSSNSRGALPDFLQQHRYVLLPVNGKVICKFPEVSLPLGPESFAGCPSCQISLSPVRISLDNHQACCINTVIDYVQEWNKNDSIVQQRPVQRIGPRPGTSSGAARDTTKSIMTQERSHIIRQWWIHAFNLVQEVIAAPTRQAVYLNMMQFRAGYRLDYVELLIAVYRRKYRQNKARKSLLRWISYWKPGASKDASYQEELEMRLRLQLKLSIAEVVRAHYEAKVIVTDQEDGVTYEDVAEDDEDDWNSDEEEDKAMGDTLVAGTTSSTASSSKSSKNWVRHMHLARGVLRSNSFVYQTMDMTPYEKMQPAVSLTLPCVEFVFFVANHYTPAPAAGRGRRLDRQRAVFSRTLVSRAWVGNISGEFRAQESKKETRTDSETVRTRPTGDSCRTVRSGKASSTKAAWVLELQCESFGARHCVANSKEEIEALVCHSFLFDDERVSFKLVVCSTGPETALRANSSSSSGENFGQSFTGTTGTRSGENLGSSQDRPLITNCWLGSVWLGEIRVRDGILHIGKLLCHLNDRSESLRGTYERGSVLKFPISFIEDCKNITHTRTRQYTERRQAHESSELLESCAGTTVKNGGSSLEWRIAVFVGGIRGRYVDFSFIPSGWFGAQKGRHWAIVQEFSLGPQRLVIRCRDWPPCFVIASTCPVSQPLGDQEASPCIKQNFGHEDMDKSVGAGLGPHHVDVEIPQAPTAAVSMPKALQSMAGAAQVSINARSDREWARMTRASITKELLLEPWATEAGEKNSSEVLRRWFRNPSGTEASRPSSGDSLGPEKSKPDVSRVYPSPGNVCWV